MSTVEDIQKYIQQVERKKEYNRSYYHTKIKPKRETEKNEIDTLKQKCAQLEAYIAQLQSGEHEDPAIVVELKSKNQKLICENFELSQQIIKLTSDNAYLTNSLELTRKQRYNIMMEKSKDLLPRLQNLSLNG